MAAKKRTAKKPPQLIPWPTELQDTADEYMHRMRRLVRQPGVHPAYQVGNAAALCALMACPKVVLPHDQEDTADGPVLHEWNRQETYEEAAALVPGALPWSKTAAGKAE